MTTIPDTQSSLLVRIRDTRDQAAWEDFCAIYRPVILQMAGRAGIQPMDCEDIAQRVLAAVARSLTRRAHDTQRARFSTWLHRVVHNAIVNAVTRHRSDQAQGGTSALLKLQQQSVFCDINPEGLRLEYHREMFRRAADRIRPEFSGRTWDAFFRTAVGRESVADVARQLSMNPGAIYTARSRVMRRIRDVVRGWSLDSDVIRSDTRTSPS